MSQPVLAFVIALNARKVSPLLSLLAIGTRPFLFLASRSPAGRKA